MATSKRNTTRSNARPSQKAVDTAYAETDIPLDERDLKTLLKLEQLLKALRRSVQAEVSKRKVAV